MRIRELETRDEDALRRFLQAIPPADRTFFKEDADDPAAVRRWIDDAREVRRGMWKVSVEVVATEQGTIDMFLALGFVAEALLRDQLWSEGEEAEDVVLLSHLADEAGQSVMLAAPHEAVA